MMNFLSLPDEMCASVLKYSSFETVLQCRRISQRIDCISKIFDLNRVEVYSLDSCEFSLTEDTLLREQNFVDELLSPTTDYQQLVYYNLVMKEYTLQPSSDEKDYYICRIGISLKQYIANPHYNLNEMIFNLANKRYIFMRYTTEDDKYKVLDEGLKKFRGIQRIGLGRGEYDAKLDECFCRNKKTFENVSTVSLQMLDFKCTTKEFNLLKNLKKVNSVFLNVNKITDFSYEEALSDYDSDLTIIGKLEEKRSSDSFGDKMLLNRMNKLPEDFSLSQFRNTFTIPVFKEFLLKLLASECKNLQYDFGILSGKHDTCADMLRLTAQHDLSYSHKLQGSILYIKMTNTRQGLGIAFAIETMEQLQ